MMELKFETQRSDLGSFINDVTHAYRYLRGDEKDFKNYEWNEASQREINQLPNELRKVYRAFKDSKVPVTTEIDRKRGMMQWTFNASKVPAEIADSFNPDDETRDSRKKDLRKYVHRYDKSSNTVILRIPCKDVVDQVGEKDLKPDIDRKDIVGQSHRRQTSSLHLNIDESKVSFKDHHICQGCGKPLSQCTCEVAEEDIDLDECMDSDEVDKSLEEDTEVDVIDLVANHFGTTDEPYEGPSFILPNGSYLDIRSCKNHSDVEYWLDQQGHSKYQDFNCRSGSPTLKSLGCIRVDTPKYYIQLPPDNITTRQYSTLKDWVDFLMTCNVPFIEVTAPGTHPVRYNFDGEIDADYVTNRVRRYYVSGTLYEDDEDPAEIPADKLEDLSGSTQPSDVGQHKVDSIDIIPEAVDCPEEYRGYLVQMSKDYPGEYEIIDPSVDEGAPIWGDTGTIKDAKEFIDNVILGGGEDE